MRTVTVGNEKLYGHFTEGGRIDKAMKTAAQVRSIVVKKIRQILRKKGLQLKTEIYRVTHVTSIETVEREMNAK